MSAFYYNRFMMTGNLKGKLAKRCAGGVVAFEAVCQRGRQLLTPLGWALFTFILAQIISLLGWEDWFPRSAAVL